MRKLSKYFVLGFLLLYCGIGFPQDTNKRVPRNFDEDEVPPYTLPDPLVATDGTQITTPEQWVQKRRPEILDLLETEMWGRPPGEIDRFESRIHSIHTTGDITYKQVILTLVKGDRSLDIPLLICLPANAGEPVPVFVAPNFKGNHTVTEDPNVIMRNDRFAIKGNDDDSRTDPRGSASFRWPLELLTSRGYALVTFGRESVLVDARDPDYEAGVYSLFPKPHEPHDWGMVAAWAWSVSRIIDYLETDDAIDASRIAVKGTSRLGRMSLWAGATDQRIGLTISNVSGKGGTSLLKRQYGLPSDEAIGAKSHRFGDNLQKYVGRIDEMPFDTHFCLALVAPRPLYVSHAEEDTKADILGAFLALKAASPVYELLGTEGFVADAMPPVNSPITSIVGMHIRPGEHEVKLYDWQCYLDFADRHLK